MPDVRLHTPRLEVVLDDDRTEVVQVRNSDMVRFDLTAAKHGWPGLQTAPHHWMTFVAWSALRREGRLSEDVKFDAFRDVHCIAIRSLTEDDQTEEVDVVVPFPAGPPDGTS